MSGKLRWCKGFIKAVSLRSHKRYRVRKKNISRVNRMRDRAFQRLYIPLYNIKSGNK